MKLMVIYRQQSDHARPVYEFLETLNRRYPDKPVTQLEIDTRAGAAEATLYGVTKYPAVIVTGHDGRVLGLWEGLPLPLIDEVIGVVVELEPTAV